MYNVTIRNLNNIFNPLLLVFCGLFLSTNQVNAQRYVMTDSLDLLQIYIQKYYKGIESETGHDSTYYYLIKAEQLAREMKADSLLAEIRDSYAYFIRGRGKIEEARRILKENINYALKVKDSFLLMRTYVAIGNDYNPFRENHSENIDSLIFYTEKGLALAIQRKDILHTLISKLNLSKYYKQVPHLKERSLILLLDAIELTDQHHEGGFFKATAYEDLALFYLEDKDYSKAIEVLHQSIAYGKERNSYGYLLTAYQNLQKIYETIGDYQKSLAAYKEIDFYKEKLKGQEVEKKITALEIQFEAERKENQINQLQVLNIQEKETSRRQRILLIILLLAGFSMGLLAYLVFQNNKKKQEAFLQLATTQKEMDAFKNRFYTNLTHEFRTPLTVIQGMANRILGNPASKEMIIRNSQSLLDLVNQMLDLQKLDAGALTIQYIQNDIIVYSRFLAEPFVVLAKNKSIHLTIYDENQTLVMDFDARYLKQVLDNLLSNAIKFTPEGGEVLLHLKKVDNNFQLKVKDSGMGISKEQLTTVFDRFYQTPTTNQHQSTGTGIGLALAKELVELMDGTIKVESEIEEGTTFTVVLPIRNKARIQNPIKLTHPHKTNVLKATRETTIQFRSTDDLPSVLLIEDNLDVLKYLEMTLKDHYKLITATNGKIGIDKAYEIIPDLIVSDIMMPEIDGLELCRTLKKDERTSHIPIILLTAKATKSNQLEGLKEGADAYIIKPFEAEELLIRIEKLLENRRQLQAYYLQWNPFSVEKVKPSNQTPFLLKVKSIIEKHLSEENFGVVQLCHALHLSRMQVHRKLKAVCDKSTAQFIREMRLQKAHLLLKTTDSTISEIAFAVGFSDPNYFSKVFADFYGYSPSVTRK